MYSLAILNDTFCHTILIGDVLKSLYSHIGDAYAVRHEFGSDKQFVAIARATILCVSNQFAPSCYIAKSFIFVYCLLIVLRHGHNIANFVSRMREKKLRLP